MVEFKVIAFTPEGFERVVYVASERQVHITESGMIERISWTTGSAGFVLDTSNYPAGTKFLLVHTKLEKDNRS